MNEEEKKAIELLDKFITEHKLFNIKQADNLEDNIQILLNLIEKQSKVIDEMAGYLVIVRDCPNEDFGANLDCEKRCSNTDELYEECWKKWFYRKVEEDE